MISVNTFSWCSPLDTAASFSLKDVTGLRRFVNIQIMPQVSNSRQYISLWKAKHVTVAESDSQCVQTHLAIQIRNCIKESNVLAIAFC